MEQERQPSTGQKPTEALPCLYLAGPINGRNDGDAKDWRDAIKIAWPGQVLDPMARDYRGKELDNVSEIVTLDKKDIADCDILVVKFDKPSVGTAMEIHLAWTLKKPVIVFTDVPGPLSPWLLYHATIVVASAEAALAIATALYRYHRRLCGVE